MDRHVFLDAYLEHCREVFDDLVREGVWPWVDSRNPEDMLESEDNPPLV